MRPSEQGDLHLVQIIGNWVDSKTGGLASLGTLALVTGLCIGRTLGEDGSLLRMAPVAVIVGVAAAVALVVRWRSRRRAVMDETPAEGTSGETTVSVSEAAASAKPRLGRRSIKRLG